MSIFFRAIFGLALFLLRFSELSADCDECQMSCEEVSCCDSSLPYLSSIISDTTLFSYYSLGKSLGIEEDYGACGFYYVPSFCSFGARPYLEGSYLFFKDGGYGASSGLGVIFNNPCNSIVGSGCIFYDMRKTNIASFHQIGSSLRFLIGCFELSANGYFPVGKKADDGHVTVFDDYDSQGAGTPYLVEAWKEQFALTGFDAEAGFRGCCHGFSGYFGLGPYYYKYHNDLEAWGGRGRLRFEIGKVFAVEGQVTWDEILKTEGRCLVEVNIPLTVFCDWAGAFCCPCPITRRIVRESPVHLSKCCHYETNY